MTSRTNATCSVMLIFVMLISMACQQQAANNSANANATAKATPANTAVAVKPTETETKPADPAPAGKEIKAADRPKMKSVIPPEGAILGGVLNDIATSLPEPDAAAAKEANASGTVTVEVLVNEKGAVVSSSVVSGPQPLWRAAGEAARKARFDPPLHNGKPVKVAGILTYEFRK